MSRTLGATVTRALALNFTIAAVLGSAALAGAMHNPGDPTAERPYAANTPAGIAAAHECWTGEAPAGATAGHVVVTLDGTTTYGGPRLVAQAVEQTFGGADHGLIVHAFCR